MTSITAKAECTEECGLTLMHFYPDLLESLVLSNQNQMQFYKCFYGREHDEYLRVKEEFERFFNVNHLYIYICCFSYNHSEKNSSDMFARN